MFGWAGKNKNPEFSCKKKSSYEVSIFLGSVGQSDREIFFERDLHYEIGKVQEIEKSKYSNAGWVPVRVSPMTLICGQSYIEKGWQISAINYPKTSTGKRNIDLFMKNLAIHLLKKFNQTRVTLVSPRRTVLYKNEG